jgi:hypothetical protein
MKKLSFVIIFFILLTKITYAEYSLKCVMETQYKFFNREKWETNILPVTVVVKDKTLEYFTKTDSRPTVFIIIEDNNNSIIALKTREFENKIAITTLSLDKIENRVTLMGVNALGLTVYSAICN